MKQPSDNTIKVRKRQGRRVIPLGTAFFVVGMVFNHHGIIQANSNDIMINISQNDERLQGG